MLKFHLSRYRLVIYALVFIIYLVNTCNAAPTQENRILRHTDGCYYNYNHYGEGDRIQTNEPCLNCTCHNQMLMCYLRVCPFTKPIDHDCVIEKREDQCCPIITCPEVPVQLMDNQVSNTEIGLPERTGCIIDDKFYPEGRQVPSNPNKPCELCYCIRNKTSCIMQECTLHIDGCQPIYNKGSCCPVRYNCDNEIENELLLEEDTTTVRPTPGFMITTPLSYVGTKDCINNGVTYADGSIVENDRPCEHCYCMRGDIVCAVQECANPMADGKQFCVSSPSPADIDNNECCPKVISCDTIEESNRTTSTELPELKKVLTTTIPTTSGLIEDISTTHQPYWDDSLIDGISSEDLQLQGHINEGHVKMNEFSSSPTHSSTIFMSITETPEILKITEDKDKHIITTTEGVSYSPDMKVVSQTESATQSSDDIISKSSTTEYVSKDTTEIPTFIRSTEESMTTESDGGPSDETNLNEHVAETNLQSTDFSSPMVNEIPDSIPGEGFCLMKGITYKSYDTIVNDCNLPCICLNSLIVCKSNCDKSLNCPKLGESLDSCCSSIKCDYDIIQPLDGDDTTSMDQSTQMQHNISLSSAGTSAPIITMITTSSSDSMSTVTERLDSFERKETSKAFEPSTATEFYYEMQSTTPSRMFEMTSTGSDLAEAIEESETKQPTMNLESLTTENVTKQTINIDKVEESAPEISQSPTEDGLISTSEPTVSDFTTEYATKSHPFEGFSIRDRITEKKPEEYATTESGFEDDHLDSSSTMKSEVLADIEKKTTLDTSSSQKDTLDQATTTSRSSSLAPDITEKISEAPIKGSSKKDDTVEPELFMESQKPVTTITYPEVSTTEFSASDLIEGTEMNDTDVKKIDSVENEIKVMEMPATSEQHISTEAVVTKARSEDETLQMSTMSPLPNEEQLPSETPRDSFSMSMSEESSSPSSTEHEKTYGYKKHEDDEQQMKFSTERSSWTPALPQESTPFYDIQNDTILDLKTEKSDSQDSMKELLFDVTTMSSTSPSSPSIYNASEEKHDITLKPLRTSTEISETERSYQPSTETEKVLENVTSAFTPEATSLGANEKEEEQEDKTMTEKQELEPPHKSTTTERQEELGTQQDTYTKEPSESHQYTPTEKAQDTPIEKTQDNSTEKPQDTPTEKTQDLDIHPSTESGDGELKGSLDVKDEKQGSEMYPVVTDGPELEGQQQTKAESDIPSSTRDEGLELKPYKDTKGEEQQMGVYQDTGTEKQEEIEPLNFTATEKQEEIEPLNVTVTEKQEEIEPLNVTAAEKQEEIEPFNVTTPRKQEEIEPLNVTTPRKQEETETHVTPTEKQEESVTHHATVTERQEESETHQGTFDDSTVSQNVEMMSTATPTEKIEQEQVEHEENLIMQHNFTTISQPELSTTTKMIDNEIVEQPTTMSSSSSPTTVSSIPQDIQQNITENNFVLDSKTTESAPIESMEDHSEHIAHEPSTPSSSDYLSTKSPSYQPNLPQLPPHYPSYAEDDYNEEEENESFGPGTCRYGGKLFVSAQQIPRDDPCDFCFCFRSDIICLQQSCPPPISGCHEEPIQGFCCPRYECPVSMAAQLNITTSTTTTTTLPPHLSHNLLQGEIIKTGCYIGGKSYKVGDRVDSTSGPCMNCRCGGDGQMKCDPKPCTPEPMLRQMIAVVSSRRR